MRILFLMVTLAALPAKAPGFGDIDGAMDRAEYRLSELQEPTPAELVRMYERLDW